MADEDISVDMKQLSMTEKVQRSGARRRPRNRPRDSRDDRPKQRREKKEKPAKTVDTIANKNPVMMLNELFSGDKAPIYKVVSQEGLANNPTFQMTCTVEGKLFQGSGKSKKEAKFACSKEAILKMFGDILQDSEATNGNDEDVDCTQDSIIPHKMSRPTDLDNWLEMEGKNPVSILNEMYPEVQYDLMSSNGPSHSPDFVMRATLNSHVVTGMGKSKKDAKLNASKALLVKLHQVMFSPMNCEMISGSGDRSDDFQRKMQNSAISGHTFADKIANLVTEKYNEVFALSTFAKRKVLAAFVVTSKNRSEVICLSTGSKCINGEALSMCGASLNDCHAEILARRGLVHWLYDQLELACANEESIFFKSKDGGFELEADVHFDMYISTAPCGDSRLFALHEEVTEHQNLLTGPSGEIGEGNRGKLRSKVESGMGTIPLTGIEKTLQTWDGIVAGERLLTMSCSDKILRWNVVGCQGSLLTHWIKPIYLRSITIGSRYHPGHMSRAFYDRCPHIESKGDFFLHKPQLLATTSPELRAVWKTSDSCINWIKGLNPEILNGASGKQISGEASRLCKMSFLAKFISLSRNGIVSPKIKMSEDNEKNVFNYQKLKLEATQYQETKMKVLEGLKDSGAGVWMSKPVELNLFSRQILNQSQHIAQTNRQVPE